MYISTIVHLQCPHGSGTARRGTGREATTNESTSARAAASAAGPWRPPCPGPQARVGCVRPRMLRAELLTQPVAMARDRGGLASGGHWWGTPTPRAPWGWAECTETSPGGERASVSIIPSTGDHRSEPGAGRGTCGVWNRNKQPVVWGESVGARTGRGG